MATFNNAFYKVNIYGGHTVCFFVFFLKHDREVQDIIDTKQDREVQDIINTQQEREVQDIMDTASGSTGQDTESLTSQSIIKNKHINQDKHPDESKPRTHRLRKLPYDGDPWAPNNLLTPEQSIHEKYPFRLHRKHNGNRSGRVGHVRDNGRVGHGRDNGRFRHGRDH